MSAKYKKRAGLRPNPHKDIDFRNAQIVDRACTDWLRRRGVNIQWKDK